MISASHNPIIENGIKVFDERGVKLDDLDEDWIERMFLSSPPLIHDPRPAPVHHAPEFARQYAQELAAEFLDIHWPEHRVALDCANGAAYQVAAWVFEALHIPYVLWNGAPNGANINRTGGSEYARWFPDKFAADLEKNELDLGVALDGDADRSVFVDRTGCFYDGDVLLAALAIQLQRRQALTRDTVVITPMSNSGLKQHLNRFNIETSQVRNGDKYLTAALLREGLSLAGEQIGHIILNDGSHRTTGDGLRTALLMLAELARQPGATLYDLSEGLRKSPQINVSVVLSLRTSLQADQIPGVPERLRQLKESVPDLLRIECRPASTEPVYRIMLEAGETSVHTLAIHAYSLARHILQTLDRREQPINILDCSGGGMIPVETL
jgi:phosphoglucosamine mutase